MRVHNAWRDRPSGIPHTKELREVKLVPIRAEVEKEMTPDELAEFRSRVAAQKAKELGAEWFGQ